MKKTRIPASIGHHSASPDNPVIVYTESPTKLLYITHASTYSSPLPPCSSLRFLSLVASLSTAVYLVKRITIAGQILYVTCAERGLVRVEAIAKTIVTLTKTVMLLGVTLA